MYRCDESDDRLSCPDITLEEASHRIGMFHVFEYLEEDNLLLIREREGEISDDRLHELSIERDLRCEPGTLGDCLIFFLDPTQLELEEFTIPELSLRSLKVIDRCREVDVSDTCLF